MIRMSELEIVPECLDEYLAILKEESKASVELASGVIFIFPIYPKENPTEISTAEIYADKKEYESHLETSHFNHFKTTTSSMVKVLRLDDKNTIDEQTISRIFNLVYSRSV